MASYNCSVCLPADVRVVSNTTTVSSTTAQHLNVLLLGESGAGKSTWINACANHVYHSTIDEAETDPICLIPTSFHVYNNKDEQVRVVVRTDDEDSNEDFEDGESPTQLPKTYVFSHNGVTVRLIDTPGISDNRGIERDQENIQNILSHISSLSYLHGICFLLPTNSSRLTFGFEYCIKELLNQLHRSAFDNIVFCFTHAKDNYFRPGDSLATLGRLLKKISDENPELTGKIDLQDKNKVYCTDGEAVRYLYPVMKGIKVMVGKDMFIDSYNKSASENVRMLKYLSTIKPHRVKETLTLNDTRRMLISITRPIAEISAKIEREMNSLSENEKKLKRQDDSTETRYVAEMIIQVKPLDRPKKVCRRCVKYDSEGIIISSPNCINVRIPGWGRVLLAINAFEKCKTCGCSWKDHMEITS